MEKERSKNKAKNKRPWMGTHSDPQGAGALAGPSKRERQATKHAPAADGEAAGKEADEETALGVPGSCCLPCCLSSSSDGATPQQAPKPPGGSRGWPSQARQKRPRSTPIGVRSFVMALKKRNKDNATII